MAELELTMFGSGGRSIVMEQHIIREAIKEWLDTDCPSIIRMSITKDTIERLVERIMERNNG